jgi:hypothetical protein
MQHKQLGLIDINTGEALSLLSLATFNSCNEAGTTAQKYSLLLFSNAW